MIGWIGTAFKALRIGSAAKSVVDVVRNNTTGSVPWKTLITEGINHWSKKTAAVRDQEIELIKATKDLEQLRILERINGYKDEVAFVIVLWPVFSLAYGSWMTAGLSAIEKTHLFFNELILLPEAYLWLLLSMLTYSLGLKPAAKGLMGMWGKK